MKKSFFYFLPFFLLVMGGFVACEEVEEAGKYDNWQARNEAFIDSLRLETGDNFVATMEEVQQLAEGELFAIKDVYASTNKNSQYIYCKKIKKLDSYENARRPLYTESVTAYYYGTLITGDKFDGNFTGYSATDQGFLNKNDADKMWASAGWSISLGAAATLLVVRMRCRDTVHWLSTCSWKVLWMKTDF